MRRGDRCALEYMTVLYRVSVIGIDIKISSNCHRFNSSTISPSSSLRLADAIRERYLMHRTKLSED